MKKYLLILLFPLLVGIDSYATTIFTVGASGANYTKIKDAYNACTGSDDYIVEIQNDYCYTCECGGTNPIQLDYKANLSAIYTVTIRPASGFSPSFSYSGVNSTASIFTLNGAQWIIFDGRAGGTGSSMDWTLITPNNGGRSFIFKEGASNNVVKYCLIKGGNISTSFSQGGLILFGQSLSATTGSNNNTIDHCTIKNNINGNDPYMLVCHQGNAATTSLRNYGNTISNCDFVNFKQHAVYAFTGNDSINILNNSFYQSSKPISGAQIKIIWIISGIGHNISGNYFGGQAPQCGGSAYSFTNGVVSFCAIWFNGGSGGKITINNNTISNINIKSSITPSGTTPVFIGIHTAGSNDYEIGSSGNGNTFGSTTGTGNIVLNFTGTASNQPVFSAIHLASTGIHSIAYNNFGAIDYSSVDTNGTDQAALIRIASNTITTIDNNTFGNTTTNNITATSNTGLLAGIYSDYTVTPTLTISNNTFQNFTINDISAGTDIKLVGLKIEDYSLPTTINNNVIKTFTNNTLAPTANFNHWDASILGISFSHINQPTGNISIYGNTVTDLVNSYTGSNQIYTVGMAVTAANTGSLSVYRNKVKKISNASTNSSSAIIGLYVSNISSDSAMIYNNIVSISDDSNTDAKIVRGISNESSSPLTNIYHNTVKINTNYSAGTATTSAFYSTPNGGSEYKIKNNIFQNVSSGNGTHYAQYWTSTYPTTTNIRNNYNENVVAANLVSWGGTDKTITSWRTAISDGSSTEVTGSITISSSTGEPASSDVIGIGGAPIPSVINDYNLNPRSITTPSIGAFEVIIPLSFSLEEITAKCVKSKLNNSEYGGTVRWTTLNETNNDYYTIEKSMDGFVWEVIDTLDGAGTIYQPTNYYYHDDFINPTPENEIVVYYRVNQTDFDGVVRTFDILSCKCEASDKIKIHPIPSNESIVINFGDQNNVPNSFQITDMFGKIIEDVTVVGDKANNTSYKLDISNYSSGRYIIKINDWQMKEDGMFIRE